jgi:sodium transport system permease protein
MWTIYLKELLELARDRRTFFTVFIPVFAMPLIFGGFGLLSNMFKSASTADMAYAMFGKEHAPQLAARFARKKAFTKSLTSPDDIKGHRCRAHQVRAGDPARPQRPAHAQQQGVIQLHYNSAAAIDLTRKRVQSVIGGENRVLREHALSALKLNQQQLAFALDPITLEDHSTADKREQMGAMVGGMLPYVLLMVCLMAAMYPASIPAPAKRSAARWKPCCWRPCRAPPSCWPSS